MSCPIYKGRYFQLIYITFILFFLMSARCAIQRGKVVDPDTKDRVGSHKAGSEIYDPAAEMAVAGLLDQAALTPIEIQNNPDVLMQYSDTGIRKICFMGVENAGGEEMGDVRAYLTEVIRTKITQADQFEVIDSRLVTAGLRETGLRVDDLLLPDKRAKFAAALGDMDTPFDYILFAKITTATTRDNKDSQVKYGLTLELVDVHSGKSIRNTAELKKHYNKSVKAKITGMF